MYQQNFLRKKRNRLLAAGIAFVLTLIVTTTLVTINGLNNHQRRVAEQAQLVQSSLNSMLSDAHEATQKASRLLGGACDFNVEKALNMLPGRYRHIYSINVVHNQHISCSSLLANKHADIGFVLPLDKALWMSRTVRSPDIYVISLITHLPQGTLYVASDLRFLYEMLGSDLVIQVSGKTLTAAGLVKDSLAAAQFSHYEALPAHSPLYTLAWRKPEMSEIIGFTLNSWLSMGFILSMSAIMAALTWLLAIRRHSLYTQLANAIRQHQIHPHYQPIICAKTNAVSGAEILARWHHDELGFVPPDVFIPVAESTGLIIDLTESLLEQVVDDLQQGIAAFQPGFKLNLNISHAHVVDSTFDLFIDYWSPIFRALGITLVFEITERENIDICDALTRKIDHIKRSGIRIALDDFGTGFSNLAFISNLSPDSIKIDRMFTRQISQEAATPLIDCVIDMAKRMNILTTAEGVEYGYQVDYLKANQIDYLQGYFFSKPLCFSDFAGYLKRYRD
ncbi:EAL domain-containing protein [Enterobacter sp. KBR-315C3_2022]|uniref:EAL domain-containing protein n=1 Tax=Enterobacter sp. KBR-315C3_2022 TaxID=3242494 RepID=UPI00352754F1